MPARELRGLSDSRTLTNEKGTENETRNITGNSDITVRSAEFSILVPRVGDDLPQGAIHHARPGAGRGTLPVSGEHANDPGTSELGRLIFVGELLAESVLSGGAEAAALAAVWRDIIPGVRRALAIEQETKHARI